MALLLFFLLLIVLFNIPVVQTRIAKVITNKLNSKYKTNIVVKRVDLSYLGNIRLKKIEINDHHEDSLIYIDKLTTSIFSYKNILDNKMEFDDIDIEGLNFVMKTHKGENNDNFSIFIEKFDKKDTIRKDVPPFLFTSSKISLNNANFYLYNENKQDQSLVFYKNINGFVEDFIIEGPEVEAKIRDLSFSENHNVNVTSLSTDYKFTKTNMVFGNTKLLTDNSSLIADIVFLYDQGNLSDFNNRVKIDATFKESEVSLIDLNKFYDELGINDKVNMSTHLEGTLNDFVLHDLNLVSNRNSIINGNFHFKNAINSESGFSLDADIDYLSSNYQNLKILLPNILGKTLPTAFERFGRFNIKGNSYITNELVDAQLEIDSELGKSISDLELTNIDNIDNAKYKGKIEFIDLDFGEMVRDSLIGKISLVADVEGEGFTLETINTALKGNISAYEYKGYTYNDIDVNGVFKNQLFNGILIARDPNLKMDFKGLADLSSEVYKFDFIAEVNYSDFNKLNLFKRDSLAVLKGIIDIKVNGNSIDNLVGQINFFNASYTNQNDNYFFKDFNVVSEFQDSVRTVTINSTDIVNGKISGVFKFNELGKLATNSLGSIYTNYNPVEVTKGQFLDFNFKIYNKIVDVFFPEVKLGPNSSIRGEINSDKEKFELSVRSPQVEAYENFIKNIRLQIDNKNPLYNTLLSVGKVDTKHYNIEDLNLVNVTLNDTLFFRTDFLGGKKLDERFQLSFYHTINENNQSVLGLKRSNIKFKSNDWIVNPTNNNQNKVVFDKAFMTFAFDKINIISDEQLIDFAGIINGKNNKDLTLNLSNVKLEGITPALEDFKLKGLVNGSINYNQTNGETLPLINLAINDLYTNNVKQGNLVIDAKGDNSLARYALQVRLKNENINHLLINGELDATTKKPTIIANYEFDKFKINTLNALGKDVITDIRGEMSGMGIITGLLENPDIDGYLNLKNAGLAIPYLNVNYELIGNPKVQLSDQTFKFLPATIKDISQNTTGILSGSVKHNKFERWFLDLFIESDNLLVLNTEEQEDIEYYGTGFMDGNASITGYTDELVIDVVGKTMPGTEFIIPLSDVSTIGDSKLINFITEVEKGIDKNTNQDVIFEKLKGLTLNFELEVTDDATAEIVIDRNTGSILRGNGNGYMAILINTNGKFEIYGSYVVSGGIYEFRNIVNKDFTVQPGGTVVWNGNPFDAFLNIDAIYGTTANPSVLLENATSNRKIDVDLITKITGQLFNSEMEFDVKLPNQSSVTNSELQFKMSDEYSKMTQFFSVLTTGSFAAAEDGILGFNLNAAGTTLLSEKISSVLSGILKSKGDKFQVGVTLDLANRDDVRSYRLDDQLGVSFSSTIAETVTVNGKVGVPVGSNTQSNIVGELEVELPLNREGTLTAKAYSRQNDIEYSVADEEGYTHGLGLSWRVDFDSAKELKERLFKKNKKAQKNKKEKDSLSPKKELINFTTQRKDTLSTKN